MSRLSQLICVIAIALSFGCVTPPPARETPNGSVIGVAIEISYVPFTFLEVQARFAYFARLDDEGEPAPPLIRSNYQSGDYVYLIDAPPGRYRLVAAGFVSQNQSAMPGTSVGAGGGVTLSVSSTSTSSNTSIAYLPTPLAEQLTVEVTDSDFRFMGELDVTGSTNWDEADETQLDSYARVAPGHKDLNFILKAFSGQRHGVVVRHELEGSPEARSRFVEHSRRAFSSEGWESVLPPVPPDPSAYPKRNSKAAPSPE